MADSSVEGRTMRVRYVDGLVLVVHPSVNPSPSDWEAYCELAASIRARHGGMATLVLTEGGAPDALQRGLYKDKVAHAGNRVAVLSTSRLARAVVTAMSWFNPAMRAFAPHEVPAAMSFLEIAETKAMREAISEMRRQLGLPPLGNESVEASPR